MKTLNLYLRICFVCLLLGAGTLWSVRHTQADDKPKPADIIAKHLDSIGPAEVRSALHGAQVKGACTVVAKLGGAGQVDGQVVMVSQGNQNMMHMTFDSPDYPLEEFKYDGKKYTGSVIRPGRRSALGSFFNTNDILFKDGLVGGVLSSSWPLLNLQEKNPRVEYAGTRKIGGQDLIALKYTPHKGSDLKITLYFDPQTFRHLRTDYQATVYSTEQRKIGGGGGALPEAHDQRSANARIEAYEEFADFKVEGGLTLPHSYNFHLAVQSETNPALVEWQVALTDFVINPQLDAKWFGSQ